MNIQNSKYFDFLYYIMRREIASNARLDTMGVIKQHSLKVLEPIEVQAPLTKSMKKLNSHLRSKTRNFQQQTGKRYVHHLRTPASFLPKIGQNNETANFQTQKSGLDSLQEHLHRMLIKNLKKCKENKSVKNLQNELDKRRLHLKEKEEASKKQNQKNRLEQLREKLKQLYGELATEQNKLKIQYTVQQKMEKKYNDFYEKMARRFRKNNTVDFGQNTEQTQQKLQSQIKKPKNQNKKGKLLSKFRVAAYAAYFISFFPKYYKEFSLIRKKQFIKTVIRQKSIQKSIQQIHDLFQIIKLKTFWKQLQARTRNIPEQTVSAILSQTDQNIKPLQYSFKIQNINSLLQFLLSNILSTVKNGKIDEFIKILANILTNRSYITDRLFLESQLFDMNVNDEMMMNLSPRQQKILIVNFLLIKLLAFSFMMNNSFICDKQQDYIFNKEKSNKYENLTFTISKKLLLCGIYLIRLCNRLNQQSKLSQVNIQGNIECKKVDRLPLPMPQLQFKSKLDFMNDQSGAASKRISIQDIIQAQKAWENGVHIKNIKNISQLINSLSENLDKQRQFIAAIIEIRDQIHKKLISFKRNIYQQIKNTALDQLSRRKTKPNRQSELAFPIRRQQQLKEVNIYCKYFKAKRPQKTPKDVEVTNKSQQIVQQSRQQQSKTSDKSSHLSAQQNFEQK